MQHTVEFWLPFPPSTNRLWRSVRGRVILGAKYKDWRKRAIESVQVLQNIRNGPVLGFHHLELKLSDSIGMRGDADNRLKPVLDIAKKLRMIVDDKLCRRATVEWSGLIDHDCLVKLTGEIAYKDQWEFANALAAKQYRKR
jgi:crossover junction endodeoxyribonuclease RusA